MISSNAIVSPQAILGEGVEIGPFCIIGPHVKIGKNTKLISGVLVDGHAEIGENNIIHHGAIIGTEPQDLKYKGDPTKVIIGNNNTIREYATINRSARMDEDTTLGDGCLLMAYSHIAHNCHVGNRVILANSVNLAGHVIIKDNVTVGGLTAIHQFVQIGRFAFVGGASGVKKDLPPFTRGEGMPYRVAGLNTVGLARNGFAPEIIAALKRIYKWFYHSKMNFAQALEAIADLGPLSPAEEEFVDFVRDSKRGISRSV